MITLTRQGLLLSLSATVIPSQGSSDVPVAVVNDINTYVGYTLEPRVGYYLNGIYKSIVCVYDSDAKTFDVPAEVFKQNGVIDITLALIDNTNANHIETCQTVHATVNKAPLGTVVLPDQTTWQDYVNSYMNQLFDSNYKPQFDQIQQDLENLVTEAQQQQQTAEQQQTQIDNAISVMGEYQIVSNDPVQIQFKQGDGTYGPTVDLGDGLASKSMVNAGYYKSIGSQYSGAASDYGIQVEEIVGAYSQGLNPSPDNPQEMQAVEISELKSSGRNMFDYQSIVDEATDAGFSTSAVLEEKEGRSCLKIDVFDLNFAKLRLLKGRFKENTQYKFYMTGYYKGTGSGLVFHVQYTDESIDYKTFRQSNSFSNIEILSDSGKTVDSIFFSFGNINTTWLDLDSSYIVELSEDTSEFPGRFVGDTVTLSEPLVLRALPNGVCDTYEDGVITRRVGVVEFDGSADENWKWQSFNVDLRNMYINIPLALKQNHLVLCDRLVSEYTNPSQQVNGSCYSTTNGNFSCFFTEGQFNSLDDFKTWLSTHPLKVWYQLAEPTTEAFEIETLQSWYPYTNAWCDSVVQPQQIAWNVLTGKSSILDGNGNLIQQGYMTPQDNLLTNSDFRSGIINQKGQTEYVNTAYKTILTVDGWFTDHGKVNVYEKSVYFDNNGSTEYGFKQPLNLPNETYTFYLDCAINGNARVFARNLENEEAINESISGTVKKSFTFTNSLKFITIIASSGTKISFNFMKLEKGSHFTGMPVWNYALELQKCLRFYEVKSIVGLAVGGTFQQFLQNTQANYYFPMEGFVTKNKTPTITVLSISSNQGPISNLTATAKGATTNSLSSLVTNNQCDRPFLVFELAIDANDY